MAYRDPTIGEAKEEQTARMATQMVASKSLMKVKNEEVIGKEKEEAEKEPRG